MSRPRLAIFDFAGCEGCQLQIINLEEELLQLIDIVDPVVWREAISEDSGEYDIALVEGAITRSEDEKRIGEIRKRARILVALGACACNGGINKIKNDFNLQEVKRYVYGEGAVEMNHLNTDLTKSVDEVVEVDYKIHGCPIDGAEFTYVIRSLVLGKIPESPSYPVCFECKLEENSCRYESNEICLGPITRGGCKARCPTNETWCYGCRGKLDEPNLFAIEELMGRFNKTGEELNNRRILFGSLSEVKNE